MNILNYWLLRSKSTYENATKNEAANGINTKNQETTLYPFEHNQFNTYVHMGAHINEASIFHTLVLL